MMIGMESSPTLERKRLLQSELARYLRVLTQYEKPEQILVFGSLVTGEIHSWSDIDLIIVKETDLPFFQRLREIRKLIQPKVGTDILVYTPEEFEQLSRERPFFQQEILAKSVTIYERER
jgi:predicted nucleotidyltransferase